MTAPARDPARDTERRIDPFTGRGVILAPFRKRLGATRPGGLPTPAERCPFCPGHEADAEPTVAQWPAEGRWQARVVANKYPVVPTGVPAGAGAHEVGVDARAHDADLADLDVDHLRGVLGLYRDRVAALEATASIRAVLLFRNRGRRAGSSQPHPHTQMVATPWVPAEVAHRWAIAQRHLEERGEPVHAVELRRELDSERTLAADAALVSFCPYAPSRPFEVRFAPRAPTGGFATATDDALSSLAAQLRDATRRLRAATSVTDFNLVLRQPPVGAEGPAAAWHLDLLPRTGGDAGFEIGTGEMIVVVTPEEAARRLREVC